MRLAVTLKAVVGLAAAACAPSPAPSPVPVAPLPKPVPPAETAAAAPEAPSDGRALFERHCATCHGTEGRGDGPAAWLLWPRPRDFTKGLFKVRSTPSGSLPTDDDLVRVIARGMPGSSMPAWPHLSEAECRALAGRVKELSAFVDEEDGKEFNFFAARPAPAPLVVPPEPPVTPESIARGRAVYLKQDCAKCHGDGGRGDGPSAAELRDDWGHPLRPNDFTRGLFKGGADGRDVYLRFSTGMSGTPMPEFGAALMTDAERWSLVHYVQSLARDGLQAAASAVPEGGTLKAARVPAAPDDPTDPAWDAVPAATVTLQLLHQRPAAARTVEVRAAHDGRRVAFLLAWDDRSEDTRSLRPEDFRDAVALQFALRGLDTPHLMGAAGLPVNIWHWKADWQADLGGFQDVERVHPAMINEWYPFQRGNPTNDRGSRPASAASHDRAFLTGWAAGNPLSNPHRRSPVEDLAAEGFGTLSSRPAGDGSPDGRGVWIGGRWRVAMARPLAAPDPCCAAFTPGAETPVAFAVWDGAAGDRNGQKSVTTWYRLALEK